MPEFLTTWEVILSAIAVLVIFILYRIVQLIIRTDLYLNWEHLIKPGVVVVIVLLLVVGIRRTERIWNNLAYINNYPVRTLMMDWPTVNTPDTSQVKAMNYYLEQRKNWPISLIGDPRKSDSIPLTVSGLSPKQTIATFLRNDTVFWDEKNDTLITGTNRILQFDSSASFVQVLDSQIVQLTDSVVYKNSPYTLKIDTWIVSDSLSVRLGEQQSEAAEQPE